MNKHHGFLGTSALALALLLSGPAAAGDDDDDDRQPTRPHSIQLIFDGLAVANTGAAPQTPAFADWCASSAMGCIPTVRQPVFDPATGKRMGSIRVWATLPFQPGGVIASSFCFSEFIVFDLEHGSIHARSGPNGTCGATMDPVLKPPKHVDKGALSVIAGGGDGVIVGGTGKYRKWTGTFTDRVFVGFGAPTSGVGGIVYYDQLLFSIAGQ